MCIRDSLCCPPFVPLVWENQGKIIRRPAGRENSRAAREIFLFNAGPVCYNFIEMCIRDRYMCELGLNLDELGYLAVCNVTVEDD